ncbi:MAG: prohibitin family protein [Desulfovibrionaceae bacterium]
MTRTETETHRNPWLAWLDAHLVGLTAWTLTLALLVLLLWPLCTVTIGSGQAGVLYSRLFGGTVTDKVYGEGLHFLFPWDTMYVYDTRLQEDTLDIQALSRGGLRVTLKLSAFHYPVYDRLPELHQSIGPNYQTQVVLPIIASAVRNTVGNYWPEDLYTSAPLKLQDEIMVQAVEQMARKPVVIDNLVIHRIDLPAQVNKAIDLKFAAEQDYLRYKYVLLKSVEVFKQRYVEAEGIRQSQNIVNPGMTEGFLRYEGIQATRDLAASPNAKLVIVGGKDGLPLLLNPDGGVTDNTKGGLAAPARPDTSPVLPGVDTQGLTNRFESLTDMIEALDQALRENLPPDWLPESETKEAQP